MSHSRGPRATDDELDDLLKVVDRLPVISSVKRDLTALRRLLFDRRAPRVATVGVEGAGRTSLANALLSASAFGDAGAAPDPEPGRWVRIDADGRRLDWLELPAGDLDATREMAWRAFEDTVPDLLIGVVAAGREVEDGPAVRDALASLREQLRKEHADAAPLLVLLTKTDTLPGAPESAEHQTAVDLAVGALREVVRPLKLPAEAVLGVCAGPIADDGSSARVGVSRVGEEIIERLPEAAQMEGVRSLEVGRESRRRVARTLVNSCSALAITVGLAPIPFADAFVLLPLQAAMVTGIAYLGGRAWDRRAGAEWIASVGLTGGAGIGLRWGAQQLVKFVPGAGSLVGAGVAGAGTLAIGRSAIAYFIDGPGGGGPRLELTAGEAPPPQLES